MRARHPDHEGTIARDGVRVVFDLYENVGPTILLMPTWSIIHSRHWKLQIHFLARHFRVITFDGRGNGRSDRPADPAAYADREFIADAVAVLDATGTKRAVVAGVSLGGHWAAMLAGLYPDRVAGAVLIGSSTSIVPNYPGRTVHPWGEELDTSEGWAKYNKHYWRRHYGEFAEWFFAQIFSEPHSTKQREDAVGWALETDAETLIATKLTTYIAGDDERATLAAIRCPVLVIHGTDDRVLTHDAGVALAEVTGGSLLSIEGGGHLPHARDPVVVNRAIGDFARRVGCVEAEAS